jgi:hypothetical protein
MLHGILALGGGTIGPFEARILRDSVSPHLHNEKEFNFAFK